MKHGSRREQAQPLGPLVLLWLTLRAVVACVVASFIGSALSVGPRLVNGSVEMKVSEQLRDAVVGLRQSV